ncbi:MAG: hypothetical protein L3J82_03850 [Planctomycetes bacterium]|nr:hypothetical protein [Planctomycetota bacterium]
MIAKSTTGNIGLFDSASALAMKLASLEIDLRGKFFGFMADGESLAEARGFGGILPATVGSGSIGFTRPLTEFPQRPQSSLPSTLFARPSIRSSALIGMLQDSQLQTALS